MLWIKRRLKASKAKDYKLPLLAGILMFAIALVEIWFVVPGISTGLGIIVDYILITLLYIICFAIACYVVVPILKFLYFPRFATLFVMMLALFIQSYIITKQIDWNSKAALIFSLIVTIVSLIISVVVSYLWFNSRKWTWLSLSLFIVLFVIGTYMVKQEQLKQTLPIVEPEVLQEIIIQKQNEYRYNPITAIDNSAEQGPFKFEHITYLSQAEQLPAYEQYTEDEVLSQIIFPTVDGSFLLQDWSWSKELYWGFTESEIPIAGQLWIPEGEGPFPIVFIMHGNHISETDSSIGYNYLAELLASHGYIVSSINANFLNYSVWSGIVDNDQLLRAWLFLAHVDSFYKANLLAIDWNNVALIGHSRGGQAAAMAVDISRWINNAEQVNILDKVNINAVVGIAPTDYTVDKKLAYLDNVNYLTIHGTLDSDLTEFFGERQFERTTVRDDFYKASVMIYGANHGQFNETWGKYDDQFPAALILNTEHILDEQAQQLAAKVFISGFLKSIFDKETNYRQLFQDYRVGFSYLPATGYITQYEDSHMNHFYTFDSERDIKSLVSSAQLDYEIVQLKGRNGSSKYNDVLEVNWDIGYSKLLFPVTKQHIGSNKKAISAFVFQVAKTKASLNEEAITTMNIEVDFITERSISRVDLKNSYSLLDPYLPTYLKLDFLEDDIKKGKYEAKEEPYLQTYIVPVDLIKNHIQASSNDWDINELKSIQFWFKDKSGTILLDDIGVIYEGGNYVKYE